MSLKSWEKEFLGSLKHVQKMSWVRALTHSIRKWTGLHKKNLERHGLIKYESRLTDQRGNSRYIDSDNCSLCLKVRNFCPDCPIRKYLKSGYCSKAYLHWIEHNNPQKMINLLKKTLEWVQKK